MKDLAHHASNVIEGLINLVGVTLFFILVLPPFLVVFLPLLALSSSVVLCGISLYITYICVSLCFEASHNAIRRLWAVTPTPDEKRMRRASIYMYGDHAALTDVQEFSEKRRLSIAVTPPRRIAQPRSRSGSMHLNKRASIHSLVGPTNDHDFEDTGGWADSKEDDEAMYMARSRTLSVQESESIYSPVMHFTDPVHGNPTPQGMRTPAAVSRPVSRGDPWKFTVGAPSPESYFSIPPLPNSKDPPNADLLFPPTAPALPGVPASGGYQPHRKSISSAESLFPATPAAPTPSLGVYQPHRKSISISSVASDRKGSQQRDSGFFG